MEAAIVLGMISMSGKRALRNYSLNFLLLAMGVVVGLVFLEVMVRALLPRPQTVIFEPDEEKVSKSDSYESAGSVELTKRVDEPGGIYVQTPTGRRLRPNTDATIRNHHLCECTVHIRTNSLGYRGPEIGPKQHTRILFLGDSITMADYVQEEETWVHIVGELSKQGPKTLETINAGVFAIGLANEFSILMETGLSTDPDVVVIGWYLNDVDPSPGIKMFRAPGYLKWSQLAHHAFQAFSVLKSKVVFEDYDRIDSDLRDSWQEQARLAFPPAESKGNPNKSKPHFNRVIHELFFDWGAAFSEGAWEYMAPIFEEFKRQSEIHGFKLAIVAFPVANQVYADFVYDYPQSQLKKIGARLEIPVLDILPILRAEQAAGNQGLFYDWCHHTPQGNAIVAQAVYEFLNAEVLGD